MTAPQQSQPPSTKPPQPNLELYQVVVQCDSEDRQREIYERMTAEGLRCRVLTM